jgi:MoaA/NifB/PqqE/SkfB family radical SAM enzyme
MAWQLTNRCSCRCLHCCEESGPERAWKSELSRDEAVRIAREAAEMGIPYAAFGGGEPLGVAHVWDVFETLVSGGTLLKIETDGLLIDERALARLKELKPASIQISLDGAAAETHEALRPGSRFRDVVKTIDRLARAGLEPEAVFIPTKLNAGEAAQTYELASSLGARVFVTGPLMRLGRAALDWERLAPSDEDWRACVAALKDVESRLGNRTRLSVYPWDILVEMKTRLDSPQAMILVVPDGKVKLLNALPFAAADLRKVSLASAWEMAKSAWSSPEVRDFILRAQTDRSLLAHANECWSLSSR